MVDMAHAPADPMAADRPVMLVSGADHSQVSRLAARVGIDTAHGTREVNLTGPAKLKLLRQLCGSFDYVGNAAADVPLWSAATRAYAVNANSVTLWLARRKRPDLIRLSTPKRSWGTWFRALRPQQWAKNLLILLPAVAAHVEWSSARIVSA